MNESLHPYVPDPHSEFDPSREIFLITDTLSRHTWALGLLRDFGRAMPVDLQSSLRAAQITAAVISRMREEDESIFSDTDVVDTTILGAGLQDVGRGIETPELRRQVYTGGIRWRDDPNAWQWDVVKRHPLQSQKLVWDATGRPDSGVGYDVSQIVKLHHTLKRTSPYPDIEEGLFDQLDPVINQGVAIVSAVDVAEACSKNYKGEGRLYLKDEEFAGRNLSEVIQGEIAVDSYIADLAAQQTLRFKQIYL